MMEEGRDKEGVKKEKKNFESEDERSGKGWGRESE